MLEDRAPLVVASLVMGAYVLFMSCHSLWRGGWTVGPRYIAMSLPFFVYLIIAMCDTLADRVPRLVASVLSGAITVSVMVTLFCSSVSQGFPFVYFNPLFEVALPLIADGYVFANAGNLMGLQGIESILPLFACVGAALVVILLGAYRGITTVRMGEASPHRATRKTMITQSLFTLGNGLLLAAVVLFVLSLPQRPWSEKKQKSLSWMRTFWRPTNQGAPSRLLEELKKAKKTRALGKSELIALAKAESKLGHLSKAKRWLSKALTPHAPSTPKKKKKLEGIKRPVKPPPVPSP